MTKNHSSSTRRHNSGFTLIELMVAITIGLFLSAVVGGVFVSSKDAFNYQDAMSRLQENARFAMERISRDVRMAGYSGCGPLTKVTNVVNGNTSNWWLNFTIPVMGYDNLSASQTQFTGAVVGSDAITLLGVEDAGVSINQALPLTAATYHTSNHTFLPGNILMITNCSQTAIFQMTATAQANNINHNTGTGYPGNSIQIPIPFPTGDIMAVYANSYYIAPSVNPNNNGNALWSCSITDQINGNGTGLCNELINGVENMQIEYGVDTDNDASANAYLAAGSITDWTKVVSVRISLLMSTPPNAGNLSSKFQTYSYNGSSVTATDRRVRHSYSSVINLRNRTK